MADNYFDPNAEDPPVAQDTSSADASKSGVRKAWDAWTSRPENNAALLQFGIAMMQPRSQSQDVVGHFANAIGEGADASTRNVAIQGAEADKEAQRQERLSTAEYRKAQGTAALKNADAYGRQVDSAGTGGGAGLARTALSAQLRTQQAFRAWLAKAEDTMGLTADPLLGAVQKEFPGIKSKADLVANPAAQRRAFQIYSQQLSTESPDTGAADPTAAEPPRSTPPAAASPPQPQLRTFYDKTTGAPRQFQWDGTKWTPMQ